MGNMVIRFVELKFLDVIVIQGHQGIYTSTETRLCPLYSATQTALMPMPVPMHMDVLPTFFPVLFSS